LNRAVAVAMRDGPATGLPLIDAILARGDLADYHLVCGLAWPTQPVQICADGWEGRRKLGLPTKRRSPGRGRSRNDASLSGGCPNCATEIERNFFHAIVDSPLCQTTLY
jgi:hypothetical protein